MDAASICASSLRFSAGSCGARSFVVAPSLLESSRLSPEDASFITARPSYATHASQLRGQEALPANAPSSPAGITLTRHRNTSLSARAPLPKWPERAAADVVGTTPPASRSAKLPFRTSRQSPGPLVFPSARHPIGLCNLAQIKAAFQVPAYR